MTKPELQELTLMLDKAAKIKVHPKDRSSKRAIEEFEALSYALKTNPDLYTSSSMHKVLVSTKNQVAKVLKDAEIS